ncbi:MAG: hypothetical protein IMZ63_00305 [Actinobacteria bacterium]|nr:hypothetical protein [Actinomycetota bacterium]
MNRQQKRRSQREEEKKSRIGSTNVSSQSKVRFVCLQCNVEEDMPEEVVEYCDAMDDGDLEVPPRFSCEKCGGEMVPKKYKGVHGIQYEY